MLSKKYLSLFAISSLIVWAIIKIPSTHAQQSPQEQIPSDLALDLELAQKNPTPEQKLISQVQTEKAQITTSQGEQLDLPIKEEIPQEIKTQSAQDTVNPNQTTSEQVIEKNEVGPTEPNGANNNLDNGTTQNNIPGTNITEPDDNSAPQVAPSTNPTDNTQTDTNTPAPAPDTTQPVNTQDNSSPSPSSGDSNSIPLENGNPPAAPAPADNPSPDNPSPDNSSSQPPPDSSSGDSTAVQGASTVSWWQIFLNQVAKVFKK